MHPVSTNQVADILHFNDKYHYFVYSFHVVLKCKIASKILTDIICQTFFH